MLQKIGAFFNVSVDYLLGRTDEPGGCQKGNGGGKGKVAGTLNGGWQDMSLDDDEDSLDAESQKLLTVKLNVFTNQERHRSGTAFFYTFDLKDRKAMVLVSNGHVLEDAHIVNCYITLDLESDEVQTACWTMFLQKENVITHPDPKVDLAIVPIGGSMDEHAQIGINYDYRSFGKETMPTTDELREISVMHNIVMVGYQNGQIDVINNTPLCRHGITATPPAKNFNGERAFLVDIGCAPGSSGSPIIAYDSIWRELPNGQLTKIEQARLIGIFCSGDTSKVRGITVPKDGEKPKKVNAYIPYGIGKAISVQCLNDFVPLLEKLCK